MAFSGSNVPNTPPGPIGSPEWIDWCERRSGQNFCLHRERYIPSDCGVRWFCDWMYEWSFYHRRELGELSIYGNESAVTHAIVCAMPMTGPFGAYRARKLREAERRRTEVQGGGDYFPKSWTQMTVSMVKHQLGEIEDEINGIPPRPRGRAIYTARKSVRPWLGREQLARRCPPRGLTLDMVSLCRDVANPNPVNDQPVVSSSVGSNSVHESSGETGNDYDYDYDEDEDD